MSKVEELRNEVVISCDPWQRDSVVRVLDSLIAAARAEGVAAERERIRNESELEECDDSVMAHFADYYRVPRETLDGRAYDELGNPCEPFFPPLLAPDKESEK